MLPVLSLSIQIPASVSPVSKFKIAVNFKALQSTFGSPHAYTDVGILFYKAWKCELSKESGKRLITTYLGRETVHLTFKYKRNFLNISTE